MRITVFYVGAVRHYVYPWNESANGGPFVLTFPLYRDYLCRQHSELWY